MGIRVPRITLKADYGNESSFGDLSLLAVGYGLHQAWVYATMFATSALFGVQRYATGLYGSSVSLTFLVSIVTYSLCLLFAAATNQRFLKFYISRRTAVAGAVLMSAGTALLLTPIGSSDAALVLETGAGIATGVGSAVLILFWGVAFSRCDSTSIVLNGATATAVGFGVYAICLRHVPFPFGGLLTALIPLLELAILWKKTPQPFLNRNEVPLFKPLPVNQAKFIVRFGGPVFVFGIALGLLRQTSIQFILPATTTDAQIIMLLAAGCTAILILITILALGGAGHWNRFFRPLVPFVAVSIFFLPFSIADNLMLATFFLLIGYMCFEALMWIFFGELAQRFRLSPIFVFGLGRGLIALAILLGSMLPIMASTWTSLLPFGENGLVISILLIMVVAYALLPDEREIEAIVIPCPLVASMSNDLTLTAPCLGKTGTAESDDDPHTDHPVGSSENGTREGATNQPPAVTGLSQPTVSEAGGEGARIRGGRFRAKCEAVANTYLLSRRETEVMFFLAKGHNSAYIQEKLYISEGTAKTHIRHIYRKLNVHTQQELMRLVEAVYLTEWN